LLLLPMLLFLLLLEEGIEFISLRSDDFQQIQNMFLWIKLNIGWYHSSLVHVVTVLDYASQINDDSFLAERDKRCSLSTRLQEDVLTCAAAKLLFFTSLAKQVTGSLLSGRIR